MIPPAVVRPPIVALHPSILTVLCLTRTCHGLEKPYSIQNLTSLST